MKIWTQYGADLGARKLKRLRSLERVRFRSAKAVSDLHETLCFLRAYPDDAQVLAQVERMLAGFHRRSDLRRFAARLADSGIAGTDTHFRFYAETAFWLARHYPQHLLVDWAELSDKQKAMLLERLPLLAHYAATLGLDEAPLTLRQWVQRMKAPGEGDGAFLARSYGAIDAGPFLKQAFFEEVDLPLRLRSAPGTPSRTHAKHRLPVHWQKVSLRSGRPDVRAALRQRPDVRTVSEHEGRELIRLAREAMVTRARDLDVFAYGDPRDVRLLDCGDGLVFAMIGFLPERRLLLEAVYGFLTLKNGVPIGYVLNSAFCGSAEVAYNVFETYRGSEAGHVYGWVLACVHHLFGVDAFTIYPYQLGQDNDEAIESGAWWFYQKFGFRPRDPGALALMQRELGLMQRRPKHRSSRTTLAKLAAHNMFYFADSPRDDVMGEIPLGRIGLAVTDYLARNLESDCARDAARRFGVRSLAGWSRNERVAWSRWAPLLLLAEGVEGWSPAERRAAVAVVRAKGGRRETEYVALFDRHRKLRAALLALGDPA